MPDAMVLGVDVMYQGEFLPSRYEAAEKSRRVDDPRELPRRGLFVPMVTTRPYLLSVCRMFFPPVSAAV